MPKPRQPSGGEKETTLATFRPYGPPDPSTVAAVAPDDAIVLSNGRFDGMDRLHVARRMEQYAADAAHKPLVVHFHGGLVSERAGLETAARLRPLYENAGGSPLFFIWKSSLWETLAANTAEVVSEGAMQVLFEKLRKALLKKLPGVASDDSLGIPAGQSLMAYLAAPTTVSFDEEMTDGLHALLGPEGSVSDYEEAALAAEIDADPTIKTLEAGIAAEPAQSVGIAAAETDGVVFRASSLTRMSPRVVSAIRLRSREPSIAAGVGTIAFIAAKLLFQIVRRFAKKRDHGLHATIVEELLHQFYIGEAAQQVWRSMKQDTEDAFGDDADCGGTALLQELRDLIRAGKRPKRVVLVAHSAGAVYICNFIKKADELLLEVEGAGTPAFQFDVVLLAPACTFELFDTTLRRFEHRIRDVRLFAMRDDIERKDQLVRLDGAAGEHATPNAVLRIIYPHSLLYFVSGVCETDRLHDMPILGLQRFYSGSKPYDAINFPEVARTRGYLRSPALTWATTVDAPAGQRSQAIHHGDFDNEAQTLASVAHLIASEPVVSADAVPLVVFPCRDGRSPKVAAQEGYTNRYLVMFKEGAAAAGAGMLFQTAGVATASFEKDSDSQQLTVTDSVVFRQFDVAVVAMDPDQVRAASVAFQASSSPIELLVPERIVHTAEDPIVTVPAPPRRLDGDRSDSTTERGVGATQSSTSEDIRVSGDYLTGLRDGAGVIVDRLLARRAEVSDGSSARLRLARVTEWQTGATWALQAILVPQSKRSGKGVRIAVLDTGFDLKHGDFANRTIQSRTFVPNESVDDRHGHGTHCVGLACGPQSPRTGPRYGVAYDSDIFVAKVLGNAGSGTDTYILAGIQWALENKCQIVSMSLAARVAPAQAFNRFYERVARRALEAGTLLIAAAGNDSVRPAFVAPVSHPADCVSIVAVAAVDQQFNPATFSNGSVNPGGGSVDLCAPGVGVLSAAPGSRTIERSGTSMATPLVAGVAALWCEETGKLGRDLWQVLNAKARNVMHPSDAIGVGLLQAP